MLPRLLLVIALVVTLVFCVTYTADAGWFFVADLRPPAPMASVAFRSTRA